MLYVEAYPALTIVAPNVEHPTSLMNVSTPAVAVAVMVIAGVEYLMIALLSVLTNPSPL